MSVFSNSIGTVLSSIRAVAGESVTVTRGASPTPGVNAVRGDAAASAQRRGDGDVVENATDWLVAAADYAVDGQVTLPRRGDTITDAGGHVYEVRPNAGGAAFRYSDSGHTQLRISTRLVDRGVTP
ncbi:MAG: hypothetical protein AAFY08_15705 [Planctomycetota bacterium]